MWALLAVCSALCLGFYDVCKKRSLGHNSILGVLTLSVVISSIMLSPMLFLGKVPATDAHGHFLILIKSVIVLSSWICAYVAIKHLSLSVVSPMQASRPMWTLLGALFLFGEVLNGWQWAGIACALGSIFVFSFTIKQEAKTEKGQGKYYVCLILAILIGAGSGLYDKFMMRHFDHNTVQVYYTFYQAALMVILCVALWLYQRPKEQLTSQDTHSSLLGANFHWRWEIVGISLFLIMSDYVYLLALSDPDSLIAVVSTIRRAGTIIPFLYGIIILKEKQIKAKILCLIGILIGLVCLLIGSL